MFATADVLLFTFQWWDAFCAHHVIVHVDTIFLEQFNIDHQLILTFHCSIERLDTVLVVQLIEQDHDVITTLVIPHATVQVTFVDDWGHTAQYVTGLATARLDMLIVHAFINVIRSCVIATVQFDTDIDQSCAVILCSVWLADVQLIDICHDNQVIVE